MDKIKEEIYGYIQIKKTLLEMIKAEEYRMGQKLPEVQELVNQTGFSVDAVRRAINELINEGVLVKRPGSGTYYQGLGKGTYIDTRIIGVISHHVLDSIYPDIIHGMEDVIHGNEYSLMLANCGRDPEKELNSVKRMRDQKLTGLIIEPTASTRGNIAEQRVLMQEVEKMNIPVVILNCHLPDFNVSSVAIDDIRAGYLAANYFLNRKHKRIAIIYRNDFAAGELRYEGFKKAVEERGNRVDERLFIGFSELDEPEQPGYKYTKQLMELGPERPTAIFYYADYVAFQAYEVFKELEIKIPGDLSIMGFDNLKPSTSVSPPLTTFEHPKYYMGKWAASMLFEEIAEKGPVHNRNLFIQPFLIERESVRDLDE